MYERYHTNKKEMPPLGKPSSKMDVIRDEHCMNCGRCVDACVYKVHERDEVDPRTMAEPKSYLCKNCLRCVEDCPQRALTVQISKEYLELGSGVWTPTRLFTIWNESTTGKLPVFGAGYRGRFVGPGFDSMWTDMSEIVRPTRDGIHGREFISTSVDLGRRVDHLEFDASGKLLTTMPRTVELPIPILIDTCRITQLNPSVIEGIAHSAKMLETLLMIPAEQSSSDQFRSYERTIVPVFSAGKTSVPTSIANPRLVEIEMSPNWRADLRALKERFPRSIIGVRVNVLNGTESTLVELASSEIDLIHLLYDEQGRESGPNGRLAKDSLLAMNKALVSASLRESISMIAGGGLAAAEHVPKSLICGADAVVLEQTVKVALGCHACPTCSDCLAKETGMTTDWTKWRVLNMVGAWRDQLLEVMGAMGVREARRLRGEVGRAIFYEDAEKDAFASMKGGV